MSNVLTTNGATGEGFSPNPPLSKLYRSHDNNNDIIVNVLHVRRRPLVASLGHWTSTVDAFQEAAANNITR